MTPNASRSAETALRTFFGVPFRTQTYRNLIYLALAFPLGLVYFVGLVSGVSLGVGLFVTLFGLPVLLVTIAASTAAAGLEAKLVRWLVGVDVALPEAVRTFEAREWVAGFDGFVGSVRRLLAARTTWTGLLLVAGKFFFGLVAFTALVTGASFAAALLSAPLTYENPNLVYQFGPSHVVVDTFGEAVAVAVVGVFVALVVLHLLNGLAWLAGRATSVLLGDASEALH